MVQIFKNSLFLATPVFIMIQKGRNKAITALTYLKILNDEEKKQE
jgi:hypothetical protein